MKVNEIKDGKVLMIGDLIIGCIETDIVDEATYKILCKVTGISHYGDVRCEALKSFPDELDWQDGDDFSWIEAIPLTAEILEKNGFKDILHPRFNERKLCKVWDNYDIQINVDNKSVHMVISPLAAIRNGRADYIFPNPDYVHEFQHILKLLGITKRIKL